MASPVPTFVPACQIDPLGQHFRPVCLLHEATDHGQTKRKMHEVPYNVAFALQISQLHIGRYLATREDLDPEHASEFGTAARPKSERN